MIVLVLRGYYGGFVAGGNFCIWRFVFDVCFGFLLVCKEGIYGGFGLWGGLR